MLHINTQREKRINEYTTRTPEQNAPTLERLAAGGQYGNTQHYVSGQDIQEAHQSGMEHYVDELARDTRVNRRQDSNSDDDVEFASRITAMTRQEQYYFRSSERSLAKVKRYQNLSQNSRFLKERATTHPNRSASKRAKKARDASKAYKKVADLQSAYEKRLEERDTREQAQDRMRRRQERTEWRAKNLADYNRLEEITRARIQAMTYAVQTRSERKDQENFSIQKGTLKNLLILRDCLDRLLMETTETAEINKLKAKQASLNKEIKKVSDKIDSLDPGSNPWINYI